MRVGTLEKLRFNCHDLGELGAFIRLRYVTTIMNEELKWQLEELKEAVGELEMYGDAEEWELGYNRALFSVIDIISDRLNKLGT